MGWKEGDFDIIVIDGIIMPGRIAKLSVVTKRAVKKSKTPNTDTPQLKDEGYDGATVALTLDLFRSSQFDDFALIAPNLTPRQPGAAASPKTIEHPICAMFNVANIYVESLTADQPSGGRMAVSVNMSEWFPEGSKKSNYQPPKDGGPFDESGVPPPDPWNLGANFP